MSYVSDPGGVVKRSVNKLYIKRQFSQLQFFSLDSKNAKSVSGDHCSLARMSLKA